MNVLIVDDNKNNRMILSLLLEEYANNHNSIAFDITEAEDGVLALGYAKKKNFDLIFMDIMMPNMDGIAATTAIRRIDKKSMIIAVSAVDDDERKKVILNSGAEDYISKPVNGDIFEARLDSYIKLISSRHGLQQRTSKPFNIFNEEVYSYNIHFNGDNEDMLSNFWEYYLLNNTPYDGISDMVRFIYDMGLAALKKANRVDIYEENTDDYLYLTLISPAELDPDLIMMYADKNDFVDNYKLEGKLLSARLRKKKVFNFIETVEVPTKKSSSPKKPDKEEPKEPLHSEKTKSDRPSSLVVFDFLDYDDFEDLKEFISRLNSLLLIVRNSDIEEYEVDEIVSILIQISRTISAYPELYNISASIGRLGQNINLYKDSFIAQASSIGPLAVAFGGDLSRWFSSLFINGASRVDFLDDSIISNALMIENFINPENADSGDENVDDIFDF